MSMDPAYEAFLKRLDPIMAKVGVKGVIAVIRAECGPEAVPGTVPEDKRDAVLAKLDAMVEG